MLAHIAHIAHIARFMLYMATTWSSLAAATEIAFDAGQWEGTYELDTQGQFEHCAISSDYEGGTSLTFMVLASKSFIVGVQNSAWSYSKGSQDSLALEVDGRHLGVYDAMVTDSGQGFVISLGKLNDWILDKLRLGVSLRIAGRDDLHFRLTGTKYALAQLKACYEFRAGGGTPPPLFGDGSQGRSGEKDLSGTLEIFLKGAGFPDAQAYKPKKGDSFEFAEVAWGDKTRGVGGLFFEPEGNESGQMLVKKLTTALADDCSGSYASQASPAYRFKNVEVNTTYVGCSDKEGGKQYHSFLVFRYTDNQEGEMVMWQFSKETDTQLREGTESIKVLMAGLIGK